MKQLGLKRDLSLLDLTFIGVGGIIGSGWLLASQAASSVAGPSAILSWLIGGIAIILVALVYAELAGMLPEAGGSVRYPQYSHGSLVSFIIGWGGWLSWVATPPAEAEAITQYANNYFHIFFNDKTGLLTMSGLVVSILLTALFFVINYFGVKLFAKINTSITWIKFVIPVGTAILIMTFGMHPSNFVSHGGFFPNGFSATLMAVGSSGIIFSLQGFRQGVELAGEARNPKRDVPLSVVLAVLICVGIYVLLQIAFIGGLTPTMLNKGWSSLSLDAPFAQLAAAVNLGWLAIILQADAMISPGGTGLVYTASTARGILAMAENGYLPKTFLHIHPKWRIPSHALIFNLIIGILTLLPFSSWNKIIAFVSVTGVISYLLGPVSASVLRRTAPELERPTKLPGLTILSPLAFIVAGLIVYWTGWPNTGYALGAVVVGLVIYFYYYLKGNFRSRHLQAGLWFAVYLIFIIVFSYIGSKSFGGLNLIPAPYDTILFAVFSLLAFFWATRSGYRTEEIIETSRKIADGEY
ncbi:amino acid transporter [Desulfosporosinus acidiphilus SJ4]|uniref:Amino acid transporter n=1 Tax=Desulfosporosinus acidiphilus (strain DSM 22704 / JCM 16185 / SJ4) TaxID=646529 RepID=I4D4Y4_DESAJ|nr:APC family permease [Desulfosporosinus acidiphilus]AFM40858.1 amino acid transporter [Desulfosporosinus acidiphilus SJ4]